MLGEPVTQKPTNLRIFVDSDILFAGCAAPTDQSANLVSFNLRHYLPGHPEVAVLRPGDLVLRVRDLLTRL
jgi:hypothetical protein